MFQIFGKVQSVTLRCAVALFWCWNVLFVCATLPLSMAVPSLLLLWWREDVPLDYVAILLAWVVVPWLCMVLASACARGRTSTLAFLFFAVEGPLFCLCLTRLLILRELTPAVMQGLAVVLAGLCVHGVERWIRPWPGNRLWHGVRIMAGTGLALAAAYATTLALLAWTPLAVRGMLELFNPIHWVQWLWACFSHPALLWFAPFAFVIIVLVAASMLAMPLCWTALCGQAWVQAWRTGPLARPQRLGAALAMLALQLAVFMHINHQPQRETFALLESQKLTASQFRALQPQLRAGLRNAYLGAYRYVSSTGESNGVAAWYHNLLWLPNDIAAWPQAAFNRLAKPLLYDGDNLEQDAKHAAELYERYFDTPIQRGERTAIAQALSATYDDNQREAGLIAIDQRKVRVAEQSVTVQAQGDQASITLEESYVNLTPNQQEIFYLFSLPESAAITGLWLGEDREHLQPFVLATRGAAQRVYKAEVQRRVDPALLEQVGPRQYRLRAFPVPPRSVERHANDATNSPKLYLRLQYTTLASHGAWPLPVLAEKRNVAWDASTQRRCNGTPCPVDLSRWWPKALPLATPAKATNHAVRIEPDGPTIVARPSTGGALPLAGKKVTLVLDRSWSMTAHRTELLDNVAALRQLSSGNTVKVLLGTTPVMQEAPRLLPLNDVSDTMLTDCMGGGTVDQLLLQASALMTEPQDLTLVVTDAGAFDLDKKKAGARLRSTGMLSMVHLGGAMAPAYDDATLESMQSSGGSAFASLPEAWSHFAQAQHAASGFLMQRDGYDFSVEDVTNVATDTTFAPIAARLLIAQATRQSTPLTLPQLDTLHHLAQRYKVVTPYSSMLVLVNTQQREALDKAEASDDRFDRTPESGNQTLTKPNNLLTANAAPEPEEWLLLLVSIAVAAWMLRQRRLQRLALHVGAT